MKSKSIWLAISLGFVCVGCNVGNAPEPMNEAQLENAVEKLPPQKQIDYINSSPMPADEKARRIAEIEAKTGYKAESKSGAPNTAGH